MRWPWSQAVEVVADEPSRSLGFGQWVEWMTYNGHTYSNFGGAPVVKGNVEIPDIRSDFSGLAGGAFKSDSIVFACMDVRSKLFSEARFVFRSKATNRLWGDSRLLPLERPWANGSTRDLLARMESDATLGGNFYARITRQGLQRMRPDWVNIICGSDVDADDPLLQIDARPIGYAYYPGGPRRPGVTPTILLPEEVVHYAPIPDPEARFRGMSWLTPVIREVRADLGYTDFKLKFLENGAVTNLFMVMDKDVSADNAKVFEEAFRAKSEGAENRYQTLFVGGGATPTPVGSTFVEMDFKATQGATETRIAAAAGTPPVLVGLSEGLQGSSLNEGNYAMARRRLADITMQPLWGSAADALSPAVDVPEDSELTIDVRRISALQEDHKDAAEIMQINASATKTLVDAGYTPESCVAAISGGDMNLLVHSGLISVQLQEPGAQTKGNENGVPPEMRQLAKRIDEIARQGGSK